jgi:hypothetical protein
MGARLARKPDDQCRHETLGWVVSNGAPASDDSNSDRQWQRWSAILTVAVSITGLLTFFGIANFDQLKHFFGSNPNPTQSLSVSGGDNGPGPIVGSPTPAPIVSSTTPAPIPTTTTPAPLPTTPIVTTSSPAPPIVPTFTPPDSGYDAQVGDCVYGAAGTGYSWSTVTCASGNFTVLAVDSGTANTKVCNSGWGTDTRYYTFANSGRDEVLCLRYNYFSVMGYATVNECFVASGPSNELTFSNTSVCTAGDVVVVAHYGTDDSSDCRSNGYATGDPPGFPGLAWTVCFNYIN